jgi:pimeloyl-ACP methyl ester carboxylesterase
MPTFESDGLNINYVVEGTGPTIVLVHGFASSLDANWRATGVIDALVAAGRQVVALDCRGHGASDKPHEPSAYSGTKIADDVIELMDYLEIRVADVMGYSMGGGIAASLLARHPQRFRTVIFGGVGDAVLAGGRGPAGSAAIAAALEADDPKAFADPVARSFRVFAERSGGDLLALAAIQRSERGGYDPEVLKKAICPVMVIVGENDTLIGSADKLAATIPGTWYVKVPGDHITAFNAPNYRNEVVAFLHRASPIHS